MFRIFRKNKQKAGAVQDVQVRPIEQSLKTELGYYFICRENLRDDEAVQQLEDWLIRKFTHGESTR